MRDGGSIDRVNYAKLRLTNSEKYTRLAEFLEELKANTNNKSKLHELFKNIVEFIKENIELDKENTELDIDSYIKNFQCSSKWPNLLINTLMIYSTASGAISAIIPGLIAEGLIVVSSTALISFTFVLPAIIVLPYFIYKIFEDMSKQERILRIEEIILLAQKYIINAEYQKRGGGISVDDSRRAPNKHFRNQGKLFNSTLLQTTYLFGTLFALGIAILTTFSLSTPAGWALVAIGSLLAGIAYSLYHGHMKKQIYNKKTKLSRIRNAIVPHEDKLFKAEATTKWQREKDELQQENKALREKNSEYEQQLSKCGVDASTQTTEIKQDSNNEACRLVV